MVIYSIKTFPSNQHAIDLLLKLFQAQDRTIRLSLLQQMLFFVENLNAKIINDTLYPLVAAGFSDSVPSVREQTMIASMVLVPKVII